MNYGWHRRIFQSHLGRLWRRLLSTRRCSCWDGGERGVGWCDPPGTMTEYPLTFHRRSLSLSHTPLSLFPWVFNLQTLQSYRISAFCVMQDQPSPPLPASACWRYVKAKIVRLALHFFFYLVGVGVTCTPVSECENQKMRWRQSTSRRRVLR